jgi:hypothetical protein
MQCAIVSDVCRHHLISINSRQITEMPERSKKWAAWPPGDFTGLRSAEGQRRQTMTPPRPITGVIADAERGIGRKITTGAGACLIDRAANLLVDFPFKRDATWRHLIGTPHAHERCRKRQGKRHGNGAARR